MFCVYVVCLCVDINKSLQNRTKHEKCFSKVGVCFVTYGQSMDLHAARHFCEIYPNTSVLPTISNDSRLQVFSEYLPEAQKVTKNKPVWLDIQKESAKLGNLSQPKGKLSL